MKKFITLLLAAVMLLSMAACGNQAAPAAASSSPAAEAPAAAEKAEGTTAAAAFEPYVPNDEPVTLRFTGWGSATRHEQRQAWIDLFMQEYPNFTIEYEAETEDSMIEKILIQTQAGSAPDIYQNTSYHLDDFWEKGLCVDLGPMIESGALSTEGYEDLLVIGQATDGTQIQWPTQAATVSGIYFNQSKLNELGVELPENGWTWSDFENIIRAAAPKLEPGVWACQDEGGTYRFFETWLIQRGKSFCSPTGLNFTKEDLAEWLTMWQNYREEGLVPPADVTSEYVGKSWQESLTMVGKALMFIQSYGVLITARKNADFEVGLVCPPWVEGGEKATPVISAGYCISSVSKHTPEAVFFLNWLNQHEQVQLDHFDFYGVCTNQKYNDKFKSDIESGAMEMMDGCMEIMAVQEYLAPYNVPYPPNPSGSTNAQELLIAANEMVAFNQMTVEEAVDDFFEQASHVFAG